MPNPSLMIFYVMSSPYAFFRGTCLAPVGALGALGAELKPVYGAGEGAWERPSRSASRLARIWAQLVSGWVVADTGCSGASKSWSGSTSGASGSGGANSARMRA